MNKEEFKNAVQNLNLKVDNFKLDKLDLYSKLLVEWNNKFNLTTITEENAIYLKHFFDSLCIVKAVNLEKIDSLCDIGTGAGFPGIVLKIFFPNLSIYLIESSKKKCEFLEEVIKILKLKKIKVINARAEEFSKKNRDLFDVVTCRAVAHLQVLVEIGVPLLKINGLFIPLKGEIQKELKESSNILTLLSCKLLKIINYQLPIEQSNRNILVIKKNATTEKIYPREYNKIIKDLKK